MILKKGDDVKNKREQINLFTLENKGAENKTGKKGQVTIFIIIGIIFVF